MFPTNRQPPGLLSFFGVKNAGRNPQYAMDAYNAVIDLLDWTLADPLIAVDLLNSAFNVAAANAFTSPGGGPFIVPNGQMWILTELTAFTAGTLGVGQSIVLAPAWATGGNFSAPYLTGPQVSAINGQTFDALAAPSTPPLRKFLKAGSQIGVYCSHIAAGPVSCSLQARVAQVTV